ncbi:MAG TPA: peptidoglycan-associated lipoprotein Pal [Vicinamibacterales bacterium]
MRRRTRCGGPALMLAALTLTAAACSSPPPKPVTRPTTTTSSSGPANTRTPAPPTPVKEPIPVPPEPVLEDAVASKSIDDLNRDSPLQPAFFEYDSAELTPDAQKVLDANAGLLKKYSTWMISIEGHTDERGTAEYNLALGERRATAARTYLVSLGIPAARLRTVSYGKEFPFEPAHEEAAWSKNRRAHFVITTK